MAGVQLCAILVLILALGFFIMGFMNIIRTKQPSDPSTADAISRQISGIGYMMLSSIILTVGWGLCFGMSGGMKQLGKSMQGVLGQ